MTDEQIKVIQALRDDGYACVLITPDELDGTSSDRVEDRLIELSWDIIGDLK